MSIFKLLRTISYLKPSQITWQFRHRLSAFWQCPESFFKRPVPDLPKIQLKPIQPFLAPGPQINSADKIKSGKLTFLNQEEFVGWPVSDWKLANLPLLWQYNLHYFEWLWALDYDSAKMAICNWIENHPLNKTNTGWQSYPTSLRLTNFCAIFFGKFQTQIQQDPQFLDKLWKSIFIQAQWLKKHLEKHLLGNHLFENAAALAFVGSCFSAPAAKSWLKTGLDILRKEIPEQILSDGVHFEISPMYHSRIMYVLALLHNTGHPEITSLTTNPLKKMALALQYLTHPDGQIALINDSAFKIYNDPAQLLSYIRNFFEIEKADLGNFALPQAGYFGHRDDKGTYLICDSAQIGPDYIPGHAHADIFSFELSFKSCRIIVDAGVHDYQLSKTRHYCRSTKAHNTIEINHCDQSEIWAAFRVARRARPHNVEFKPAKDGFRLTGWHDGYKRLKGSPVHYREFNWENSGKLAVKDTVNASTRQNIISRLHLHPDCQISQLKDNKALITYPKGQCRITFLGKGKLSVEDSLYFPEFGIEIKNKALVFSLSANNAETGFNIEQL